MHLRSRMARVFDQAHGCRTLLDGLKGISLPRSSRDDFMTIFRQCDPGLMCCRTGDKGRQNMLYKNIKSPSTMMKNGSEQRKRAAQKSDASTTRVRFRKVPGLGDGDLLLSGLPPPLLHCPPYMNLRKLRGDYM